MNRHFFFAAAISLAFATGCGPTAQGGSGTGAPSDPSTTGAGGSFALGAGGDAAGGDRESPSEEGLGGSGGSTPVTPPPDPSGDPGAPCIVCSSVLGGDAAGALCGPSQTALESLLACACADACATVCGNGAADNCLDAWEGDPPLDCKTCLISSTGCGAAWDACLADDGVTPPDAASSSTGGGSGCSCDPGLPLCPGGGSCSTPGAFDAPGNEACGSAEYCAPCCDPGNACAVQGACKVTQIDQTPCSMDYECCSGVCTAGKCDGGCGILISF